MFTLVRSGCDRDSCCLLQRKMWSSESVSLAFIYSIAVMMSINLDRLSSSSLLLVSASSAWILSNTVPVGCTFLFQSCISKCLLTQFQLSLPPSSSYWQSWASCFCLFANLPFHFCLPDVPMLLEPELLALTEKWERGQSAVYSSLLGKKSFLLSSWDYNICVRCTFQSSDKIHFRWVLQLQIQNADSGIIVWQPNMPWLWRALPIWAVTLTVPIVTLWTVGFLSVTSSFVWSWGAKAVTLGEKKKHENMKTTLGERQRFQMIHHDIADIFSLIRKQISKLCTKMEVRPK